MPWELGSGLRSNYDLTINNAFFAPDAQYQDGATILLHIEGTDEDGEEASEMYNVGKDWTSPDGGSTIISTKGSKTINRSSMYGRFIQAVFECDSKLPVLLEQRGDATDAKVWLGLTFHMDEQEITFGRGLNPTYRNMPTRFLGGIGQGSFNQPAAARETSNESQPESSERPATSQPGTSGVSAADRIKAARTAAQSAPLPVVEPPSTSEANGHVDSATALRSLAESSPDLASFIDSAVELPGVAEDEELLNLVLDPTENGFYSLYHK